MNKSSVYINPPNRAIIIIGTNVQALIYEDFELILCSLDVFCGNMQGAREE